MNCVPEFNYEDLGISEDAISRGGVTRSEYDPNAPEEPIQGELFDAIGDRNLDEVIRQREFLKNGLNDIHKLKEMFSSKEAQEGLARARDQITVAAHDAREALSSTELNEKLIEFRTRIQDAGAGGPGGQGMGRLSLQQLGTGELGAPLGGVRDSYKPTNAAQRAKLAQQRSASKAARAMRKKNRRK